MLQPNRRKKRNSLGRPALLLLEGDGVLAEEVAQLAQPLVHGGHALELGLEPHLLLLEAHARRGVEGHELPAALAVELQQVVVVLPQRRSVRDRQQRNA